MASKPEKTPTLFQAATTGGRVIKQPQLVQFIVDGNGAMVTTAQEFYQVEKWANSRFGSGNRLSDRARFLEQIQTLISRPGSFISTKGSTKPLEDLCKMMKAAGYDLAEWQLPHELKDMGRPPAPKPVVKTSPDAGASEQEGSESKPDP